MQKAPGDPTANSAGFPRNSTQQQRQRQAAAPSSCNKQLHQAAATSSCTKQLHQAAATSSCTKQLQQAAATSSCTKQQAAASQRGGVRATTTTTTADRTNANTTLRRVRQPAIGNRAAPWPLQPDAQAPPAQACIPAVRHVTTLQLSLPSAPPPPPECWWVRLAVGTKHPHLQKCVSRPMAPAWSGWPQCRAARASDESARVHGWPQDR